MTLRERTLCDAVERLWERERELTSACRTCELKSATGAFRGQIAKLKKIESSEGERKSTRMRRLSLPLQSVLLRLCAVGESGRGPVNVNSQLKVRSKSTSIDA